MTPDHLSYSSLNTYSSCPRAYYLSRVKQAEPLPAWYFVVGTSVHEFIARTLAVNPYAVSGTPSPPDLEEIFMAEVASQMELEPDTSKWLYSGSDSDRIVEERALKLAQDCVENAVTFLDDMDVWHVEYDATGHLPGCTMEIKAFIDIIGEHKKHGPIIGDWKTGKSKPKDNIQLEGYNLLYKEKSIGAKALDFKGLYIMLNPDARKARPVTFKHTPESLGKMYAGLEQQINNRIAKPEPQFNCKFCSMKPNCKLMAGPTERASYYDTPIKDGWLPF